jgi:hypothetical protein
MLKTDLNSFIRINYFRKGSAPGADAEILREEIAA